MRTTARVVVIGGGAMGVSLLYHLARLGWSDCVLVERQELTAGSTWHAAGLCTHFAHNATIMEMRAASVRLYRDILPKETGLPTGFHPTGALRVTRSRDRMDEFRQVQGLGRFVGHEFHVLTLDELKKIYPLTETGDGLIGAWYEPNDGHVDPTLATNAMAAGARAAGAEIVRHNPVTAIARTAGGEWLVTTKEGTIRAEHVVNAAGTWAREVGAMMGVDVPMVPMLHQYVVTDTVPAVAERIAAGAPELPIIRDPEESWYLRQERDGFIVGPYEAAATPWAVDGVPPAFGMELLPPELDRVEHILEKAMARVPALATGGIKTVVNGPITFTPDANPLIGPAFGLPNAWLLTGSSMGVMEGGGAGRFLAGWITSGAPPSDALAIDPRRFGGYADRAYRLDKAIECFGLQFGVHFPFEEREAGRPRRMSAALDRFVAEGAVLGTAYGWERPNWFRTAGDAAPALTFRRQGWQEAVGRECRAVMDAAGIADLSPFSKFEVTGPSAQRFVDGLGSNRAPRRDGRIGLTQVLTPAGGIASEFTVTRLGGDRFYLTSAAMAERQDEDLLRTRIAAHPDLRLENVTEARGILGLMGPRSREILAPLAEADLSTARLPWLSAVETSVAGVPVRLLRVSYVGELGYELHAPASELGHLYDALWQAGRAHGIRPYGAFAMNAMRLEKGYRAFGMDLTTERTPLETGLHHLVRPDEGDYVGRDAMRARAARDDHWRMALLEIARPNDSDPFYAHVVLHGEQPVGIVTSAAYGHRTGKSLALAFLKPEAAGAREFEMLILGERHRAVELVHPPYDPDNRRMKV
ncbi:MAG: FAD-dependent oxidoreductase [Hyphomicrobiaceae bacterium]